MSLPKASKHGFQIRNQGRLFEFQTEEDIIALLEGIGFEKPRIEQCTSVLMTGWFNAYDAHDKHVYGCCRRTVNDKFIFEVWEMKD